MMNSFNHYSLGSVGQWLYEHVAGIRAAEPGYGHVLIAPEPGELEWARATYRSVRGPITSAWRREGDDAPPRGRDPAERHRDRASCPAARPVEVGSGRHRFNGVLAPV